MRERKKYTNDESKEILEKNKRELELKIAAIKLGEGFVVNDYIKSHFIDEVRSEEDKRANDRQAYLYYRTTFNKCFGEKKSLAIVKAENAKPKRAPIIMPKYKPTFSERHPGLAFGIEMLGFFKDEIASSPVGKVAKAAGIPLKAMASVAGASALIGIDLLAFGLSEGMAMNAESYGDFYGAASIRDAYRDFYDDVIKEFYR